MATLSGNPHVREKWLIAARKSYESGPFHCYASLAGFHWLLSSKRAKNLFVRKAKKSGPRSRSPLLTPCSTRCRRTHKEPVEHALSPVLHHMDGRTLPPVRACLVYHPRVKAKASGPTPPLHHHLPGLDAGWCSTSSSPRRDAGASRGRRLTAHLGDGSRSKGAVTWGPIRRLQLTRPPRLPTKPSHRMLALALF
jgi:hypothetical protein